MTRTVAAPMPAETLPVSAARPALSARAFTLLLVGAYFVMALAGVLRHELWQDEAQACLIARDSVTLHDLFLSMRSEGHPALWHLSLWVLTRFWHDPLGMQLFHLAIATASAAVFVACSPFSRLQKTFFVLGYFALYEYAVIS